MTAEQLRSNLDFLSQEYVKWGRVYRNSPEKPLTVAMGRFNLFWGALKQIEKEREETLEAYQLKLQEDIRDYTIESYWLAANAATRP